MESQIFLFENMKDIDAIGCIWLKIVCRLYIIVTIMNYIRFYIFFVKSKSICSRVKFCYTDKFCKNSIPFGNHPWDEFKRKNQDFNVPLLTFIGSKKKWMWTEVFLISL
jgi:hypothetical protein